MRNIQNKCSEKIRRLERDSNPRHPDFMTGALPTELPRQLQWRGVQISSKTLILTEHLLPGLTELGIASVMTYEPHHAVTVAILVKYINDLTASRSQ